MSGQDRPGRLTEAQRQAIAQAGRNLDAQGVTAGQGQENAHQATVQAGRSLDTQGVAAGPSVSEGNTGQLPYQQTPGAAMPPSASSSGTREQAIEPPERQTEAPAHSQQAAPAQQPEQQNIIQQKAEQNASRAEAQAQEREQGKEKGPTPER